MFNPLSLIPTRVQLYAFGAAALALLMGLLHWRGRRQGRKDVIHEQRKDYIDRTEAAREGYWDASREDEAPEEQLAAIRREWD